MLSLHHRIQIQEVTEAELVNLLDNGMNLNTSVNLSHKEPGRRGGRSKGEPERRLSVALVPSLSTSNSMARFIEEQSTLRCKHH